MTLRDLSEKLALLCVSTAFGLLLAEGLVRTFFPQDLYLNASWYVADPVCEFRHRPNLDREMRWGELYHLRTNSRGLREDREVPYDPDHMWRVLVHGDSMTFGNGTEHEFIYPVLAQNYLREHGIASAEVVNMAVSAHGPSLEYLYFKEEGIKYRPKVVVVAAYLGNDVMDEVRDKAYTLDGDRLVFRSFPVSRVKRYTDSRLYQFLVNHSHLLIVVRKALSRSDEEMLAAYTDERAFSSEIEAAMRVWLLFYREIEKAGAAPVLLILPTREQMLAYEGHPVEHDPYEFAAPTRDALLKACAEQDLRCVDALPALAARFDHPDDAFVKDGNHRDIHYNKLGHAVVGEMLGKVLLGLATAR